MRTWTKGRMVGREEKRNKQQQKKMLGDWSGPIAALAGLASVIGIFSCYSHTKKYRKASRLLNMAKEKELLNVPEALQRFNASNLKDYAYVEGLVHSLSNSSVVFTESRPYTYSIYNRGTVESDRGILVSASKFLLASGPQPSALSFDSSPVTLPILPSARTKSVGFNGIMRPESWVLGMIGLLAELVFPFPTLLDFRFGYNDYTVSEGDHAIVFGTVEYSLSKESPEMSQALYISGSSKTDIIQRISDLARSLKWKAIGSGVVTGVLIGLFGCAAYWAYSRWRQRRNAAALLPDGPRAPDVVRVNDFRCAVCKERPRTIIFQPCSHLAVCDACQDQHYFIQCPTCHRPIEGVSKAILA